MTPPVPDTGEVRSGARAASDPDLLPAHLHALRQVHRGLRRDARRLQGAVLILPAQAETVLGWWERVRAVLDWHLGCKEQLLFPAVQHAPGWSQSRAALLDDHAALRAAAQSVSRALARAAAIPLTEQPRPAESPGRPEESPASVLSWFEELLQAHLGLAEQLLWPAVARTLTVGEFHRLERRVLLRAGPTLLPFLAPWVLDGLDPDSAPGVLATMPPPVRALSRTALAWRYQRWRWW